MKKNKTKNADEQTAKLHNDDYARAKEMILAGGGAVRCAALTMEDGRVHVLFTKNASQTHCIGRYMAKEVYGAIWLLAVATPEDFARHGPLVEAPDHFDYSQFKPPSARLNDAAPAMLAALLRAERFLVEVARTDFGGVDELHAVQLAIAKAKGGAA